MIVIFGVTVLLHYSILNGRDRYSGGVMNDVRASGFSLLPGQQNGYCAEYSVLNTVIYCIVSSPVVTMTHPICRFPWMEQ